MNDRRHFLKSSVMATASFLLGCSTEKEQDGPIGLTSTGELLGNSIKDPFAGGEYLTSIPFRDDAAYVCGERQNSGLDGRLALDLSQVKSLNVSTEDFFIRSFCPDEWPGLENWKIPILGLVEKPIDLAVDDILKQSQSMGSVVMECAGNGLPLRFGLMSAAEWQGVLLDDVLKKVTPSSKATRVLISGVDAKTTRSTHSYCGASWVFTLDQLKEAGAFIATGMNGQPLTKDHGAPVRLVVPGWYGCTCIKWLNEIRFVDDTEPATTQMQEFALRTHQREVHKLAKNYLAARIDRTAVPIRIEKWRLDGKTVYRVVGLTWGGLNDSSAEDELLIRFSPHEEYQPVTASPKLKAGKSWAVWSHRWEPDRAVSYPIQLKVANQQVETRRLEMEWYKRFVKIEEPTA